MRAATKRRVTRNCQGQQAITADLAPTLTTPAAEPVTKSPVKKAYRSERADDWAHTTVGDLWPCVICGTSALMRDPYTGRPCHLICAKTQARERGEKW